MIFMESVVMTKNRHRSRAFTLIELLIVVAIIAILAAIAVPNFLEAQIRSKVSRVKSDLRTISTGIESYTVDNHKAMYDGESGSMHHGWMSSFARMTTPVSYLTSVPSDPFQDPAMKVAECETGTTFFIDYPSMNKHSYDYGTFYWETGNGTDTAKSEVWNRAFGVSRWKIGSCGPDKQFQPSPDLYYGFGNDYDPTNGTISEGDVYRSQSKR
jgi:general secretion pathway protein G